MEGLQTLNGLVRVDFSCECETEQNCEARQGASHPDVSDKSGASRRAEAEEEKKQGGQQGCSKEL